MRMPLALAALLLTACSSINSQTNAYATLAEAEQAGAVAHGWIPDGLPASAHDLREGHVPGSNDRWGLFEYPQEGGRAVLALLERSELVLNGQECRVPARIEWWPLMLRGPLDSTRLSTTGVHVYRARKQDLLFAVNWSQGRAYYCTI
jgi:hypothetical protein